MSDQPPKKKRGRRPKNKIISNINPVFDSNGLDDILFVYLYLMLYCTVYTICGGVVE